MGAVVNSPVTTAHGSRGTPERHETAARDNDTRRKVEKPWLKSYAPGVPAEIDPGAYGSIGISSARAASASPGTRVHVHDRTMTYAELDRASRDFAAYCRTSRA